MSYRLQDLIDIEHFQNLQDRLNKIYSFPSAIIDNDGVILTATAWQEICTEFHRDNPDSEASCIESDKYIREHLHEANPTVSYRCPHGLVDNATPIIIDGVHYGNFFTGQFFLEPPDLEFFRGQARRYGFDESAYLRAVVKVPIWTQEQLDNYLFFIKGLIEVIAESGLKKLREMENRRTIEDSERRHRSILKTAMDGFWLTDLEGRLIEVNDAYCEMSGYRADELVSMRIEDLDANEGSELVALHIRKLIEVRADRFETVHRRKDGSRYDAEVSAQFRPEDGGRIVCFVRDITERKRSREAIETLNRRLTMAADSAGMGVWDLDIENDVLTWDEGMYRIYGLEPDGFNRAYDLWARGVHPEDLPRANAEVQRAIHEGAPFDSSFRIVRPDGEVRHVKAFGRVTRNRQGRPASMTGINLDVTAQKRLEAQLQQAQRLESIGTLAGGIAHDFNNILSPIVGLSEMLMEDSPPGSAEAESAREILQAARRGSGLVKQILAFGRQSERQRVPVNLDEVLSEVLKLSRATIPSYIRITREVQGDCGHVLGDPSQIHQIVMNLVTNAYHAFGEKYGEIVVGLRQARLSATDLSGSELSPGRYAVLRIADSGAGIDPAVAERIFEPYFTTKEPGKGTGLGLAVVYGIVREHGGHVRIESEQGKGTVATVILPLTEESSHAVVGEPPERPHPGTESVLLVDDEEAVVRVEARMLERLGYTVTARSTSEEALAAFNERPGAYDLVLTDMTMPGMTGDELARRIHAIRADIPVIVCSGFGERLNEETAASFGIDGFLMKPVLTSGLAAMVRRVLDAAKAGEGRWAARAEEPSGRGPCG